MVPTSITRELAVLSHVTTYIQLTRLFYPKILGKITLEDVMTCVLSMLTFANALFLIWLVFLPVSLPLTLTWQ